MGWDGMGWDGMGWDGMGWDGMGWDGNGMQMRIGTDGDGLSTGHMGWVGSKINSVLGTSCASHGVKAARGSPGCLALRGGESSAYSTQISPEAAASAACLVTNAGSFTVTTVLMPCNTTLQAQGMHGVVHDCSKL